MDPTLVAAAASGEMAKNDAVAEIHMYIDIYAEECPAGLDPVLWRRYNYTCGLRNMAFAGMLLVSLLFVPLAAVLLCRLPAAPPSAVAPAPAAETELVRDSASVVWTVSLLLSSYLSFWIYTFALTIGAAAVFFRVSYGASLAYTAAGLVGPVAGVAVAHLSTAWAAGLLGYALAEYRMHTGSECAADVAAARTPPSRSEGQTLTLIHCVFMTSLTTLSMSARVVWLVFFPFYGEEDQFLLVLELSVLIWWILFFWAILMNYYLLHEALFSNDSVKRLLYYYIASCALSILCSLLGSWFFVYYFGLEMMAMAAFFGYILAVIARCKDILARDQPILKDLELGDVVQETTQALTRENV